MGEGWYVGKRGGATGGSDLTRGGHAGTVLGELGQSVPVKKNCSGLHISPLVGGLAGTSGESLAEARPIFSGLLVYQVTKRNKHDLMLCIFNSQYIDI